MLDTQDLSSNEISSAPLAFLRTLVEEWRIVIGLPVAAGILAVLISFLLRPMYEASVTFVPESQNTKLPASLAGLAGRRAER